MKRQPPENQNAVTDKKQLLSAVNEIYRGWVAGLPLACRKGCAACCTRNVTMTSLEGEAILDFVERAGREKWLLERLARVAPGKNRLSMTTNQFAAACLGRREVDDAGMDDWDFTPCIFVEENVCTIYAARPFGCRSFGSLQRCAPGSAAEIAPMHLAVNTVFTQIIEHVCSASGYWGLMNDMLRALTDKESGAENTHLLPARPLPGFLLEPREARLVRTLVDRLAQRFGDTGMFVELIDNCLTME